jgi:hypothetical protein
MSFRVALNDSSACGADADFCISIPPLFRFTNRLYRSGRVPVATGGENLFVRPCIPIAILQFFAELLGIHGATERRAGRAYEPLYTLGELNPDIGRTRGARRLIGIHSRGAALLLPPSHLLKIGETLFKYSNNFQHLGHLIGEFSGFLGHCNCGSLPTLFSTVEVNFAFASVAACVQ